MSGVTTFAILVAITIIFEAGFVIWLLRMPDKRKRQEEENSNQESG